MNAFHTERATSERATSERATPPQTFGPNFDTTGTYSDRPLNRRGGGERVTPKLSPNSEEQFEHVKEEKE